MNGKVNGQTGKGTFTIMEVRNGGWGRLKSGAGWIWLSNPTYCTVGKTVTITEDKKKTIDELAKEVIRGDWGNGTERKEKLTAAGYDYAAIQKRVNEMLKQVTMEILCIVLMIPFYLAICKCVDDARIEFEELQKWIEDSKQS